MTEQSSLSWDTAAVSYNSKEQVPDIYLFNTNVGENNFTAADTNILNS
jgi:hypothetical protein